MYGVIMPDIIQQFARKGMRVFPLEGKIPAVPKGTDWKTIPKDPTLSRLDISDNYAVHCEDILVIDVDVKKGAKGKESFAALTTDLNLGAGWEASTFVVRTGSGGFHIYLSLPITTETQLLLPQYPGLEFRHGPFYVVGPESIYPETKVKYDVVFGCLDAIIPCPERLSALIIKKKVVDVGVAPEKGFVDDSVENIYRFKEIQKQVVMPDDNKKAATEL